MSVLDNTMLLFLLSEAKALCIRWCSEAKVPKFTWAPTNFQFKSRKSSRDYYYQICKLFSLSACNCEITFQSEKATFLVWSVVVQIDSHTANPKPAVRRPLCKVIECPPPSDCFSPCHTASTGGAGVGLIYGPTLAGCAPHFYRCLPSTSFISWGLFTLACVWKSPTCSLLIELIGITTELMAPGFVHLLPCELPPRLPIVLRPFHKDYLLSLQNRSIVSARAWVCLMKAEWQTAQ